jgi:hypothetical protein
MEQISRIGMDTSKRFFQVHGVNAAETVGFAQEAEAQGNRRVFREACADGSWDRSLRRFPIRTARTKWRPAQPPQSSFTRQAYNVLESSPSKSN